MLDYVCLLCSHEYTSQIQYNSKGVTSALGYSLAFKPQKRSCS